MTGVRRGRQAARRTPAGRQPQLTPAQAADIARAHHEARVAVARGTGFAKAMDEAAAARAAEKQARLDAVKNNAAKTPAAKAKAPAVKRGTAARKTAAKGRR